MTTIRQMGITVKAAARTLARASTEEKNTALEAIGREVGEQRAAILEANRRDVERGRQNGLTPALIDRLMLDEARLEGILADLHRVADLPNPVGEVFEPQTLPNGLKVHKQRVPVGVIGVIYESRPNVTLDVTGLCLKSGNGVVLRGGSEALLTNRALVGAIQDALAKTSLPAGAVQFIPDPDRGLVLEMLQMDEAIDMIIPRGSAALHQFCRENSRIPVITGGIGICHLFVDESADQTAAVEVIRNAKTQRPSVCNALDTVLVHRAAAAEFLPRLVERLAADGVSFRAEPDALACIPEAQRGCVQLAGPQDFDTEWLSLVLGLKVVDGLEEAIEHIEAHSTGHSDGILTRDEEHARRFVRLVDSAAVYVNASTRFTDGGQLGLGAEIAVSTQKLHARGPMGLRELTSYKWVVSGENHIRP